MIFNLFKSKPTLRELIPNGFVDIHSHILPGIDDGAKDVNESKELIEEMKGIGFTKIIGTPHTYPGLYENTEGSIKKSYNKIKNLKNINLDFASEYMIDHTLIEKARNKELLCIKDNYVLVEVGFIDFPYNIYEIIFNIILNDYIPILAHPERYLYLNNNIKPLVKLKRQGCLFQLNLLSTTGYYGKSVVNFTDKLLKKKLFDFVGSDIHSKKHIEAFNNKVVISERLELRRIIDSNYRFK